MCLAAWSACREYFENWKDSASFRVPTRIHCLQQNKEGCFPTSAFQLWNYQDSKLQTSQSRGSFLALWCLALRSLMLPLRE